MNELIKKLLNEQTTPEEEHQIAQMLQQEEDMESWLTEDETAEYDRIVSQRSTKLRILRWAIAAAIAILLVAGAVILWPQQTSEPQVAITKITPASNSNEVKEQPLLPQKEVQQPALEKVKAKSVKRRQASTTDSLQYYIARLEKELENVNESTYTAKAEEVLRADARLQRLVQRIMIGELAKDNVPAEALNTTKTTEGQP
jgi:hypothetical protein